MTKKVLDKAKKLKELADRGVGGEKTNAQDMLTKYMAKHNLTLKDIEGHKGKGAYANMSDEEFLMEVKIDLVMLGLSYVFGLFIRNEPQYKAYKEMLNEKSKQLGQDITERYKVKTNSAPSKD